jgi:hypothetical protein
MSKSSIALFTVTNLAYLPKALVLAESVKEHAKLSLNIYLIDQKREIPFTENLAEIHWIEDLKIDGFQRLAFKYDITELSTSLKPYLAMLLLKQHEKVLFFDPDTCLYAPIDPILDDLNENPIILTPHYTKPQDLTDESSDLGMMRFGSFNLGFFAVNRHQEAISYLEWWHSRCMNLCYFETQFGLSTDQKWVTIAPCFFPSLKVSFNLGYNVAFWNMHERHISQDNTGQYLINDSAPLIFFHFSSFDESNPDLLTRRPFPEQSGGREDWFGISRDYLDRMGRYKEPYAKMKYGFDHFKDGSYISPTLRRAYAAVEKEYSSDLDPFESGGQIYQFAKRNSLLSKPGSSYISSGYGDKNNHGRKFILVYWLMRIILRIIGPNEFNNFSRLLVYLSSYRQNRGLWK